MNDIKDCFGNNSKRYNENTSDISIDALLKERQDFLTFCTPGHKQELCSDDISEWKGGEIFPKNSVAVAEEKTRQHYRVKKLRFLVNGASIGIKASILCASVDFVAPTFSHKSVFDGAKLAKVRAFTFCCTEEDGLPNLPTLNDYIQAFEKYPSAKMAVVTSPDYFGRTVQIEPISNWCKQNNKMLLVDASHGAHFATRPDLFPKGGETFGDFAVLSAHKTLRALTQTAFGVCNNEQYFTQYDDAIELLSTTSPFYPFYAQLNNAIRFEIQNAQKYDELKKACGELKKTIRCKQNDDFLRLVVDCGKHCEKTFDMLVQNGIMPETYYDRYCIFIVTLSDSVQKVGKLKEILKNTIGGNV